MNKKEKELLEEFSEVQLIKGEGKNLVGYAEMFGSDCIPLYMGINYMPYNNPKELQKEIKKLNRKAMKADGFEESLVGILKLEDGKHILVHDRQQIIDKLISDFSKDTSGLFEDEQDIQESALEFYSYNIIGGYMEGIPAFAVLYSK